MGYGDNAALRVGPRFGFGNGGTYNTFVEPGITAGMDYRLRGPALDKADDAYLYLSFSAEADFRRFIGVSDQKTSTSIFGARAGAGLEAGTNAFALQLSISPGIEFVGARTIENERSGAKLEDLPLKPVLAFQASFAFLLGGGIFDSDLSNHQLRFAGSLEGALLDPSATLKEMESQNGDKRSYFVVSVQYRHLL